MALSIVVPAFNEEAYIRNTIERLFTTIGNAIRFEVIVVDNASTDNTPDILKSIPNVTVITLPVKQTVSAARNVGWKKAQFPLVAFIDGDMLITKTWLEALLEAQLDLIQNPLQITGCRVSLSEEPSWLEDVWFGNINPARTGQRYINSGNLLTTKSVIEAINGFDESLITGEDVDFCRRATENGATLNINYGFVAHHEGYPKTIKRFFKRERWHGIGDVKSFATFLKSRVAIFSFLVVSLCIAGFVSLLLKQFSLFILCLLAASILNTYAIYTRFKINSIPSAVKLFYLQLLYAVARSLSLFDRRKI